MGVYDSSCIICANCLLDKYYDEKLNIEKKLNKWLTQVYIITNDKKKISIKNYYDDGQGEYTKNKLIYNVTPYNWFLTDNFGFICHKNCYKLICKKLNYKLKFIDICNLSIEDRLIKPIKNYGKIIKYEPDAQSYYYNYKMIKNDPWLLKDPLINIENQKRILKMWKPLIKKIKKKIYKPYPCISASKFGQGIKKFGYDGNLWKVKLSKNKQKQWIKI